MRCCQCETVHDCFLHKYFSLVISPRFTNGTYKSNDRMSGEGEETQKKGFRLLGILDVQNVPCAREAVLYGAGGALATGLLHFLATSRVRRSYHVGFAGFMVTTLGSWFYCRMNNAKLRVQQRMIQEGLRNKVVYEGTTMDPSNSSPSETSPRIS